VHYAKRFAITSLTRDTDYDITTGAPDSKILWFTVNHNGEAETVKISLRPKKGLKKLQLEWDFSELAIKGRASRGNLVTKNSIAKIQLKSKGVTTLEGKDIWWDPDIQRLNEEGRGDHLGKFAGEDRVLAIFADGTYYTTTYDLVNKYQGDIVYIGKLDPALVYTVLYWDNAAKAYYVKRFSFVESNNTPVSFISEARGSKLVDFSADLHPQIVLTFGGKHAHREAEVIDAEEFIAKKGLTAKGKKCSPYDLKTVEFGEPLHKPEDDLPAEEPTIAEPAVDEPISDEPAVDDQPVDVDVDLTAAEAPAPEVPASESPADDKPLDFDDWEPTLF
jgi:topoisomerase-4 subunit A